MRRGKWKRIERAPEGSLSRAELEQPDTKPSPVEMEHPDRRELDSQTRPVELIGGRTGDTLRTGGLDSDY